MTRLNEKEVYAQVTDREFRYFKSTYASFGNNPKPLFTINLDQIEKVERVSR